MEANFSKRSRRPNFSVEENYMLLQEWMNRQHIFREKISKTVTMGMKKAAWEEITFAVNSVGIAVRTSEEIRRKFADLKYLVKKKASELKQTESGVVEIAPLTQLEEEFLATMKETQLEDLPGMCDSGDYDYSQEITMHPHDDIPVALAEAFSGSELTSVANNQAVSCTFNLSSITPAASNEKEAAEGNACHNSDQEDGSGSWRMSPYALIPKGSDPSDGVDPVKLGPKHKIRVTKFVSQDSSSKVKPAAENLSKTVLTSAPETLQHSQTQSSIPSKKTHSSTSYENSLQSKKRKTEDPLDRGVVNGCPSEKESAPVEVGNFDAFAKYLAVQLRQLPLKNAVNLQMKIHNLITEEKLKILDKKPSSTSVPRATLAPSDAVNNGLGIDASTDSNDMNLRNSQVENSNGEGNSESGLQSLVLEESECISSREASGTHKSKALSRSTLGEVVTPQSATTVKKRRQGLPVDKVSDTPSQVFPADEEAVKLEVDFDAFGNYIASQLKQPLIRNAIEIQNKIHNLVSIELLKIIQEQKSTKGVINSSNTIFDPDPGSGESDSTFIKCETESVSSMVE